MPKDLGPFADEESWQAFVDAYKVCRERGEISSITVNVTEDFYERIPCWLRRDDVQVRVEPVYEPRATFTFERR